MTQASQYGAAVVIGASMAGLLAARALSDTFREVLLIERDALPDFEEARRSPRKGVPQGNQPHLLLVRGHETLERLFPGFTQEMIALGADQIDVGERLRWYQDGAFYKKYPIGHRLLLASRLAIEAVVRARVMRLPNVHLVDSAAVLGLLHDPACTRVTGVKIERRSPAGPQDQEIVADLVVDATGRGSRTPAWLEEMGFSRPQEERVEVKVTYASRFYARQPDDLDGDAGMMIAPEVGRPTFGLLLAQEGSDQAPMRWQLVLGGLFGHAPGPGDQDYLDFARSLPDAGIYDLIKERPPLTPILIHKFPASQRRRYDRLARFPAGLLAFGDAIASFNPAYGQGMTVSTLEALALQDSLKDGLDGLARRFFKKAAGLIDIAWTTAVGADLKFPETQARRTPITRVMTWYMDRLIVATHHDPDLRAAFLEVTNLIQPPQSLLAPRVAAKVFRRSHA
jgi:2-polyprenyl-6-methoxyphenol hydroxylase-like FAD-dependent oxidoreductase